MRRNKTKLICTVIATAVAATFAGPKAAHAVTTGSDFTVPPNVSDGIEATGGTLIDIAANGIVSNPDGRAIRLFSSGYTVTNAGQILAPDDQGIFSNVDGQTVINSGTIQADSRGVELAGTGNTLTNLAGGTIYSTGHRGAVVGSGSTINNAGTIKSDVNHGLRLDDGDSTVNNYATGLIQSGTSSDDGINFDGDAIVHNWGRIEATDDGVKIDGEGNVINYAGGVITTDNTALSIDEHLTLTNHGTLRGETDSGVSGDLTGSIINYGLISAGDRNAVLEDNDGIDIDYEIELDNYGRIEANSLTDGEAVTMGNGVVRNHAGGEIYSGHDGMVVVGLTPGTTPPTPALGSSTIINDGSIEGETGTAIYFVGSENLGTPGDVFDHAVQNSGSIVGGGGTAVQFAEGNDEMTITGGQIIGDIKGNHGHDTVHIDVAQTFTYDDDIVEFEQLNKDGAGNAVLNGNIDITSANLTQGRLSINGALTGDLQVGAGGEFGGIGVIDGNAVVGGVLAPGNSAGTLSILGDLIMQQGAILTWDIDDSGLTDALLVGGLASATGQWTLIIMSDVRPPADSYELLNNLSSVDSSFFNNLARVELPAHWQADITIGPDSVLLANSIGTPEPATIALAGLALLGLGAATRRRGA